VTADKDSENILAKEVESWKGFEYALRNPNASLFNKMLTECLESDEYVEALKTRGPQFSAESLFMALIFQQQKTISGLIERIRTNQNRKKMRTVQHNPDRPTGILF
jgi:hypothetical protein